MKKSSTTTFVVGAKRLASGGSFRQVALPEGGSALMMDRKAFKSATGKADAKIREIVASNKGR